MPAPQKVACLICSYNNHSSYTKCDACGAQIIAPRTQKSRGVYTLYTWFSGKPHIQTVKIKTLVQKPDDILAAHLPAFARPCPSVPRHGYFDSKVVKTVKQLAGMLAEVLADDPNGEVMLCETVNSAHNAIWTPGALVVGKGNDGATLGKETVTVPLAGSHNLYKEMLKQAGIAETNWPYIEVVYPASTLDGTSYPILTQLREGPQLAGLTGNHIPAPTVVETIIHADPDKFKDIGWEVEMEANKNKSGVVVWYPGGSILSHFAIHARLANLPILFDAEAPPIGSILEPNSGKLTFDPAEMLKGFIAGNKVPLKLGTNHVHVNKLGKAALVALHHATAMGGSSSKWIGMSAAILLRLGIAALNGEARHFSGNAKQSRETVYEIAGKKSLTFHRARINRLINIFRYGRWQSAGFGGTKWACCGATVLDVLNTIWRLSVNPTEDNASEVVKSLNLMVNQAHNGGWWFNKFLPENLFDEIAGGEIIHTIGAGPGFYDLDETYRELTPGVVATNIDRIKAWGEAVLNPPRIGSAKIIYSPGINSLEIKVQSRLLKTRFKPLHVADVSALKGLKLKDVRSSLYLIEGEDGYKLELRTQDPPKVIWEDASLRNLSVEASKKSPHK